ncbi:uncharacterized protein Bfra_002161 [Botrytis fragariae]|uniref:Uncharacterized protein n=1 Tax=Botrytis fragariae TaxID=1964551 RepID=A0A8H6B1M6_9HELO|nr:uncharacterized protein Bfra_002161 [Botrytis fragariae]KAF5877793.1 hypothetical protein Bfra_002161 [Botrytis fragariae]
MSASTTPDMCWLWGGLENGVRSSPPLPADEFLKGPNFVPANQNAWSLETDNAVRAQEPDHRPATQQQVGQSSSDYQGSSSVSEASALQPYCIQQAGGFMGGYSQGYVSEQQPAYHAAHPGQHTQYQENQGSSSDSESWAIQTFTGRTSATQSYVCQPPDGYTGVHSRGYQSGQSGQDDQYYYD